MFLVRRILVASTALAVAGALASSPMASPAAGAQQPCAGLESVASFAGGVACTHGADPLPVVGAARASSFGDVSPPPAPCVGNGKGGRRVRVLYGYPDGTTNRIKHQKTKVRRAVALADENLDLATADVEGQHYRFFCDGDAAVTVTPVRLVEIGTDLTFTFGDVMSSLVNQKGLGLGEENFASSRFVYAVFVDNIACCYPYGGQANLSQDDRADPAVNANNEEFGQRYSMIRWGLSPQSEAEIFQHEVGHNLGAVQLSAPHSSGAFHCYDGEDVMCYDDGGPYFQGGGTMTSTCVLQANGLPPFDCGADDYYAAAPLAGSYLASHWNLASSGWLTWNSS